GNPIADRWGKAQCRKHRFEWNGEHRLVRFTDVRHYDDEGFPRRRQRDIYCHYRMLWPQTYPTSKADD
ncbi:hypothetical protein ONO57_26955, partial [Salmonella enterica subsp. enterica serovar Anatum]|nr:hypothetical protein [Salmonella enterica subsp. enterica serovar Anatum]